MAVGLFYSQHPYVHIALTLTIYIMQRYSCSPADCASMQSYALPLAWFCFLFCFLPLEVMQT